MQLRWRGLLTPSPCPTMLQRPALHDAHFFHDCYQPPLDSPLSPLRHDRGQRRRKLRSQRRTAQGRDCQHGRLTMRRCLAPLAPQVPPPSLPAPSPSKSPLTSFLRLLQPHPHPPPPPRDRPPLSRSAAHSPALHHIFTPQPFVPSLALSPEMGVFAPSSPFFENV